MSGVTYRIDDAEVQAELLRLIAAVTNPAPALDAIGAALVSRVDLGFRDESDPWGTLWAPLSDTTLSRRRGSSAQILRDTGRLANSFSHQVQGGSLAVGTDVIYAGPHQFGRPENRFYNTPRGRPAPIPARASLPIRPGGAVDLPNDWRDDITDAIRTHLAGAGP